MTDSDAVELWRLIVTTEQLDNGTWRASIPARDWSQVGDSEQEARDRVVTHAIRSVKMLTRLYATLRDAPSSWRGTIPGWAGCGASRRRRNSQRWQLAGMVSQRWMDRNGSDEQDAIDSAKTEWFHRREDPDEIARRIALMRRISSSLYPVCRTRPAAC